MRLRLLPVLIVTAGLTLTVRVGALWQGFASHAEAQTTPSAAAAGQAAPSAAPAQAAAVPTAAAPRAAPGAGSKAAPGTGSGTTACGPAAGTLGLDPRAGLSSDPLSMTDQEIDLLQALSDRRRELDQRARQLDERNALMQAAEQRIEEKVSGLKVLQKSIEDLLAKHREDTESQYKSLVKIYENMRPKDAAQIFEELDMAVLLPVVERMKERKTAPILAKMTPAKAKALTEELARRRRLPEEIQKGPKKPK